MKPNTKAQSILNRIYYATLSTVDPNGNPWNSPVYCAYDENYNVYWSSHVESIYTFDDDITKDLAIVHVNKGYKTPLQRVLKGTKTVEGYMSGDATLTITLQDGSKKHFIFTTEGPNPDVETEVRIGELMQWAAKTGLTFYEICEPPYEDGRFENLEEEV